LFDDLFEFVGLGKLTDTLSRDLTVVGRRVFRGVRNFRFGSINGVFRGGPCGFIGGNRRGANV
jgi:hypothetical protein